MRKVSLSIAALALAAAAMPSSTIAKAEQTQVRASNGSGQAQKAQPARDANRRTSPARLIAWGELPNSYYRRARPGWTNRHVQRMAAKKRNQARNRKACRG
jgi:hypothetical protein